MPNRLFNLIMCTYPWKNKCFFTGIRTLVGSNEKVPYTFFKKWANPGLFFRLFSSFQHVTI